MPEPAPEPVEPGTATLIIKGLRKSGLLEKLVTWLAIALVGGGASMATQNVSEANYGAEIAHLKAEILRLEGESQRRWKSFYERRAVDQNQGKREHLYFERRFTRIETRLGVEAPPAPAEAVERE